MHLLFRARTARGITFILNLIAIVGSLLPPQQMEQITFNLSDKLIHCLYYTGLTFFWIKSTEEPSNRKIIKTALLVFLFGLVLEILQGTLPIQRNMDFFDLLANSVGILLALVSEHFLRVNVK
tara:strand:+ start:520 stop:888 length:369 start_codon:yes stop_codon:yes gene_type:complete